MSTDKPVALKDLLAHPGSALAGFRQRAKHTEDLTHALSAVFPEPVRPHLISAGVHGDRLILTADAAVWAARMRFYVSDAIEYMASNHNSPINRVDVRVRPDWRDRDGDAAPDAPSD